MMPGKGKEQDHFVALDTQPKYRLDNGDLMIHLQAPDLGSLNSGSLVYFRKIPVGKVYDYAINPNKQGVVIDVLIERRFTDLVKKGSRFWNVSGVDANVSISGAKVKLESLAALVNGAIAFDSPEESKPAEAEDTFGLYEDLAHSQRRTRRRSEGDAATDKLVKGAGFHYAARQTKVQTVTRCQPEDGIVTHQVLIAFTDAHRNHHAI